MPTNISDTIADIKQYPYYDSGPDFASGAHLMVRVLTNNESEFENGRYQFALSHFISLNVNVDDGLDEIRDQDEHIDYNWFTLGPAEAGNLVLRLGSKKSEILETKVLPEDRAAELIRSGINHLSKET